MPIYGRFRMFQNDVGLHLFGYLICLFYCFIEMNRSMTRHAPTSLFDKSVVHEIFFLMFCPQQQRDRETKTERKRDRGTLPSRQRNKLAEAVLTVI